MVLNTNPKVVRRKKPTGGSGQSLQSYDTLVRKRNFRRNHTVYRTEGRLNAQEEADELS